MTYKCVDCGFMPTERDLRRGVLCPMCTMESTTRWFVDANGRLSLLEDLSPETYRIETLWCGKDEASCVHVGVDVPGEGFRIDDTYDLHTGPKRF